MMRKHRLKTVSGIAVLLVIALAAAGCLGTPENGDNGQNGFEFEPPENFNDPFIPDDSEENPVFPPGDDGNDDPIDEENADDGREDESLGL